jgi:hypothetical protein
MNQLIEQNNKKVLLCVYVILNHLLLLQYDAVIFLIISKVRRWEPGTVKDELADIISGF